MPGVDVKNCCSILVFLMAVVAPAGAAHDIYLYVDGIPGQSKDVAHVGWIDVTSFGHCVGAADTNATTSCGGSTYRGRKTHEDLVVGKFLDKASPLLLDACCRGERIADAVIQFHRIDGDRIRFYEITFTSPIVESVSTSGVAADAPLTPSETVRFSYEGIRWTYTEIDPLSGEPAGDVVVDASTMPDGPDSDLDGMPDSYEDAHDLDSERNDADEDADKDGLSNYHEYLAGTAASHPRSVLKITGSSDVSTGGHRVVWNSERDHLYEVSVSPNVDGPYSFYSEIVAQEPETALIVDVPWPRAFVRVKVLP